VRSDATRATSYDVVTAVWGAEFIDLFLELCIPNQLSPANLPALPPGSRYRIFTTRADVPRLAADPRLDDVRRVLPVDVVEVDMTEADRQVTPGESWNVHKRMIACHRRAAADAAIGERALIFLAPDFVLAEGTIAALVRIHSGGARAVLTANLRLLREEFVAALSARGGNGTLEPRELVGLAMRHLHPWTRSLMADGTSTSDNPTSVYWPVRSGSAVEGLLVRSFYLHPMLVDPVLRTLMPGGPIDSHYVRDCCPDLTQCHVVDDSDDLVVFELSPAGRVISNERSRRGVSPLRLAAVAANCDRHQLSHWQRPIRLRAGNLDARWTAVEQASARLARQVERYRPYGPVLVKTYSLLKSWGQRRSAYGRTYRRVRRYARDVRKALQRRVANAREVPKTLRPRVTSKQIARPAKVLWHQAAKTLKLRFKRIRRDAFVGRVLPAAPKPRSGEGGRTRR
jgi:hypothetical protein